MNIIHIKVTFVDSFSKAKLEKTVTRSEDTFKKMQASIGQVCPQFENGIKYLWEVTKVERA